MLLGQNVKVDTAVNRSADLNRLEQALPGLGPRSRHLQRANLVLRCLAAIIATALVLEAAARFVVSVSGAYVGPSIEFDRAYALAQQPCPPSRQLIVCIGGSFSKRARIRNSLKSV